LKVKSLFLKKEDARKGDVLKKVKKACLIRDAPEKK
jgi:hypothetical protein